jgi:uncharacterized protein (DUF1778 family)
MKSDDTKTETLQFKVTEQERKLIEKCAQRKGRPSPNMYAEPSS